MGGDGSQAGPSVAGRALLAVVLTITFYALALGVAAVLIVGPIALWVSSGTGNIWITIAMVVAGFTILRAIVPVREQFVPPGPELDEASQPELHTADRSARRTALRNSLGEEAHGAGDEQLDGFQLYLLAMLVTGALHDAGWRVEALPGDAITCSLDGERVEPFLELARIADGTDPVDSWVARWSETAVGRLPLTPIRS